MMSGPAGEAPAKVAAAATAAPGPTARRMEEMIFVKVFMANFG